MTRSTNIIPGDLVIYEGGMRAPAHGRSTLSIGEQYCVLDSFPKSGFIQLLNDRGLKANYNARFFRRLENEKSEVPYSNDCPFPLPVDASGNL